MGQTLADGQLAATAGTLYTGAAPVSIVDLMLANTSASLTETIVLRLLRSGSTARRFLRCTLAPNEQAIIQGIPLAPGDLIDGSATDATTVDFTVSSGTGELRMQLLDANGAVKGSNSGSVPGNQTVSGHLIAKQLAEGPAPTDTYAATMTIDVTAGLHVVAAVSGTSATCTMTPSGAGAAGDRLTIITEADGSGTVTVTFASTFHSSGTQATTLSKFSTITFESDGSRWLEVSRVTALT